MNAERNSPHGSPQTVRVVAALIFREGRFLVARRAADDPLGPVWEFPGGKVERGEGLPEALRREIVEELGVRVEVGELVETVRHDYAHRSVELFFFRCMLASGEVQGRDAQEICWASPAEMTGMPFPAADARLLARLPTLARSWAEDS